MTVAIVVSVVSLCSLLGLAAVMAGKHRQRRCCRLSCTFEVAVKGCDLLGGLTAALPWWWLRPACLV